MAYVWSSVQDLLIELYDTIVGLHASVLALFIAWIATFLSELLRKMASFAAAATSVLWKAVATTVTTWSVCVDFGSSALTSLLSWPAPMVRRLFGIVARLASTPISELLKANRATFQRLNLTTYLSFRFGAALMLVSFFFWLTGRFDSADTIRVDYFANALARKFMINRDHDLAYFTGLACILASCTTLWNLVRPDFEGSICAVVLYSTWILWLVTKQEVLTKLNTRGGLIQVGTIVQEAWGACSKYIGGNTWREACIRELRNDLAESKRSNNTLQEAHHDLQERYDALDHSLSKLQAQLGNFKKKKDALYKEQARATKLSSQVKALGINLTASRQTAAKLLEAKNEAQFEVELLKCTSPTASLAEPSLIADLAVPFVLVLIDGDAYNWSDSHFAQTMYPPGASAAQAIKFEVQRYLVDHKEQISVQSRIVVRVFQNIPVRHPTRHMHHSDFLVRYPAEFPRDFTQSMPLFDFIDSGVGKERVDSKIQESTHLFISNPSCHRIFLATTTDNGFARLLEQYAYNSALRNKVVLIHPGYVIHEIAALEFEAIEWPSVFQKRVMPDMSKSKAKNMARHAAKARLEQEIASVRMMVEIAPTIDVFRELSRAGASGVFRRTGKEFTAKQQVQDQDEDKGVNGVSAASLINESDRIEEKLQQIVQERASQTDSSATPVDVLKQEIKEVCDNTIRHETNE